jgi:hypothetical protein
MNITRSKFWWQSTADDCAACGKFPHRLVVGVDLLPAIGCRCGNTGPSGINVGIAICRVEQISAVRPEEEHECGMRIFPFLVTGKPELI